MSPNAKVICLTFPGSMHCVAPDIYTSNSILNAFPSTLKQKALYLSVTSQTDQTWMGFPSKVQSLSFKIQCFSPLPHSFCPRNAWQRT